MKGPSGPLKMVLLFVLWPCLILSLYGQPYLHFTHLSLEEGLSQSSAQSILQDSEGLIWIGTQNGLNRYDGRHFTVYQNNPYDPYSIMNNMVLSLCEDDIGNIWVGTLGGGLLRFEKKTGRFYSLMADSTLHGSFNENVIWSLYFDQEEDMLWIGGSTQLLRYDRIRKTIENFSGPGMAMELDINPSFLCLFKDRDKNLWFGTNGSGLARYNATSGSVTWFRNDPANNHSISNNIIWSITQDHSGNIWTGTNDGVSIFDPVTGLFTSINSQSKSRPGLTNNVIWSILEDWDHQIWIGTDNGLHYLDTLNQRFYVYKNIPYDNKSLSNNLIWTIYQSRSGSIWLGTNQGVNLFSPSRLKFIHYRHDPDQSNSLPQEPVCAICEDHQGMVWIGTDGGGLARMEKNGTLVLFKHNTLDPNSIPGDRIWSIIEDRDKMLWIGTYGAGLCKYDPNTGLFSSYRDAPGDPARLSNSRVLVIHEDRHGTLWLGTRGGGLCALDKYSGTFRCYQHDPSDSLSIPVNVVTSILEDSKGNLWIGTFAGGLCLFDRQTGIFRHVQDTSGHPVLGTSMDVWSLLEDKKGILWAGTSTGLYMIHSIDLASCRLNFSHLTTSSGLPGNTILGLMEDADSVIWITSFNGISRLDPSLLDLRFFKGYLSDNRSSFYSPFRNYEVSDGLQSNEFNQGAYHQGKSGRLYAGGINGLNIIEPKQIHETTFQPQIIFTGLKMFYKDVRIRPELFNDRNGNQMTVDSLLRVVVSDDLYFIPQSVTYAKGIILDHHMNVLSIEFASLDYYNPTRIRYACRLDDFEKDWNMLGTANTATYTNLNPGHYTFWLKATNADGVWNDHPVSLEIIIRPPLWRTTWFIILSVIISLAVLAAVIYLVVRRQQMVIRRRAEQERELAELRLKTIKSQMDPHFTFNAINAIGSFIYNEPPDVTYDYFGKFSKLIRETLQNTDKIYISLGEELEFVKTYLDLEKIRFKEKFNFIITVNDRVDKKVLVPKMIIQSYAENAVKHGLMHRPKGGLLEIQVTLRDQTLEFTITDNGIGRQKAAELIPTGTQRGLRIMNQFFEIHNKLYKNRIVQKITDLKDENGQPAGTRVSIIYPLIQSSTSA